MQKQKPTILIVGAGPTGLTLACTLLQRGIACRIIDKRPSPSTHSKALGVSATSLMIFERLGVSSALATDNVHMQDTYFYWQGKRMVHTNYRYLTHTKYPFMLLAHQTETERYLYERLLELGGQVERGVALASLTQTSSQVDVVLQDMNGAQESASYEEVIGCDGSQSKVREMIGVDFKGTDYGLHFIYGDFELSGWHGDPSIAHYYLDGQDLLIMLPTITGTYRIVGLIPGDKNQRPMPDQAMLQAYLDKFGPGGIQLKNPTQFGSVPIYYRIADKVRDRRVFLAGDAFHLFSPIGGQGMNSGIQDAYNLGWKLALVKQGKAKPILLDSYEAERLPLVHEVIENVKRSVEFILCDDKAESSIIKALLPTFANRHYFRRVAPKNYSGFNYRYNLSHAIQEHAFVEPGAGSPIAGQYTNDSYCLHSINDMTLLLDIDTANEIPSSYQLEAEKIIANYNFIQLRQRPSTATPTFTLIRPDGYIAYQNKLAQIGQLSDYLQQFYQASTHHAA